MSPLPEPIAALIQLIKNDAQPVIERNRHEVFIARAPGRLDVMGGIADYTGSLVCEMPLDVGAAVAIQRRDDRKLVLHSYNAAAGTGRVELSLDDFYQSASLTPVQEVQHFFSGDRHWAGYVAGAYYLLAKHRKLNRRAPGANIACYSTVPLGAGVSSSAALEVAAFNALISAYHFILEPLETAVMAQRVENQIVGAPCGVMDQVTSMLGKAGQLLLLHCQPHEIKGYVSVPAGCMIAGINSNVKHSVGGSAYRNTRIAAFMAHAIIAKAYKDMGIRGDPTKGYLANVNAAVYRDYFRRILPRNLKGRDFLAQYKSTIDRVTTVDGGSVYQVRAAADHHVLENRRVGKFVDALQEANKGSRKALIRAGRLMVASHASYGQRARMGSKETDLLVRLAMESGAEGGIYGAKITGGGSGGTVALLCDSSARAHAALESIQADYRKRTKLEPTIFTGTSPGAAETPAVKFSADQIMKG